MRLVKKKNPSKILYATLVTDVQAELAKRYSRTGITPDYIDKQVEKLLRMDMIVAEPKKLDTNKRTNMIGYSVY